MKKVSLFGIIVIICLSVMTLSIFATNTEVSNIKFSTAGFKMFLSGTDHKMHPGFVVQFPYNTKSAYFKFVIDNEEEEIEVFERNIVNDDSEVKFQSLYDTDYEFELLDTQQNKNVIIKGYDINNQLIEQGTFQLVIPVKPQITKVLINDKLYSENMNMTNPVKIDIFTNSELAKNKLLNNVLLLQNNNKIMCDYEMIDANHIRISSKEALLPGLKTELVIKKYLTDINNISLSENDSIYSLLVTNSVQKPLLVDSVNIDNHQSLTRNKVSAFNNPQQVSITFNQLINFSNLILSEIYTNSQGIYIKEKNNDNSNARLIEPTFSIVFEDGTYKSKVVFKMVGKMGYFNHDPLNNNTNYAIVIEKKLISESKTTLAEDVIYEFSTQDVVERSYTLDTDDNVLIYVNNKLQSKSIQVPKGAHIKLIAKNNPGFKLSTWNFSRNFEENFANEYDLIKPQLHNVEIDFNMPPTDLYVSIDYLKISEKEKQELEKQKAEVKEFINSLKFLDISIKNNYQTQIDNINDLNSLLKIKKEAISQHITNYKQYVIKELTKMQNLDENTRNKLIQELDNLNDEDSILALFNRAKSYKKNNSITIVEYAESENSISKINRKLPQTGAK